MAKKKPSPKNDPPELPTLEPGPAVAVEPTPEPTPEVEPTEAAESEIESGTWKLEEKSIAVPVRSGCPAAYKPRNIDIRGLTELQATTAFELLEGLKHKGAKLLNGQPVQRHRDLVCWLLEQVGNNVHDANEC